MSPDATPDPAPRWTFGVEPLEQALVVAPLLRSVAALVQGLDRAEPAVAQLIEDLRAAELALAGVVPPDPTPRLGPDATSDQRPYVDHARDVGTHNPCFPEYDIVVDGPRASGQVTFPLVFEGPPGVVHGGVLATFFDCVIQHHNCDVGVAGKTTSLRVDYRRPTPLGVPLTFEIDRNTAGRRITSVAQLLLGTEVQCTATMDAVAGDLSQLPSVPPRPPAT